MSFLRMLRATSRKKLILILATEERIGPPAPALGPSPRPASGQGRHRRCGGSAGGSEGHEATAGGERRTRGIGQGGGGHAPQVPPLPRAPFPRM